jgi:signal transduction histidine kinase
VLDFGPDDLGRPIGAFSAALCNDGLVGEAKSVLKTLVPADREVKMPNGRWFLRRILPCRDDDDCVNGVTITFADITESKRNAETLEQRVSERTAQLRALAVELSLAEERERRALAQDLHDDLGQVLAAAKIKLGTLSKLEHAEQTQKRCEDIAALLDRAHDLVRSLTFQLSPPVLSELGLVPALEWLADEMRRLYDLQIRVQDDGIKKKLDTSVSTILFRAVRELLSNVAKHAKVSRAKVTIRRVGRQILVQVMDQGVGLQPPRRAKVSKSGRAKGFGLLSVQERLNYIGGEMRLESVPGGGTLVTLIAPLAVSPRTAVRKT